MNRLEKVLFGLGFISVVWCIALFTIADRAAAGRVRRIEGNQVFFYRVDSALTEGKIVVDTFPIASAKDEGFNGTAYYGRFILNKSDDTVGNYGHFFTRDTINMWLKAEKYGILYNLDSVKNGTFPCTLRVARTHATTNDTLFKDGFMLIVRVKDSASVVDTVRLPLTYQFDIMEQ